MKALLGAFYEEKALVRAFSGLCEGSLTAIVQMDLEDHDLYLRIVWELHGEAGGEVGHDGVGLIEPDAQHREAERADNRREEAAPVVADSEVDAGDLQIEHRCYGYEDISRHCWSPRC